MSAGGGVAILSALPENEAKEILEKNEGQYAAFPGITITSLIKETRRSRLAGYTYTKDHLIDGVDCIAQAVHDPYNIPIFSVAVVSVASRIEPRLDELTKAVNDTALEMELILKTKDINITSCQYTGENDENSKLCL